MTADNYHLLNADTIGKMKDGVYVVNNARGGLIDHAAMLEALKGGKVAGFGFDVYENETAFLRKKDVKPEQLDPVFAELLSMDNVIYTAHTGFYTDKAIESMIQVTMDNLGQYAKDGCCKNELVK